MHKKNKAGFNELIIESVASCHCNLYKIMQNHIKQFQLLTHSSDSIYSDLK